MVANASEAASTIVGPQHVCIVSETYPPEVNGVAHTLGNLVKGLLNRGQRVSLVRPRQRQADFQDRRYDSAVMLVRGLPLPGYKGLQFGVPAGKLLRRAWTRDRPDVVYVATEGPLGWSAIRIAKLLEIPSCSGFHTNFDTYSKHYGVGCLRPLIIRYLCSFHNRSGATLVPTPDLRDRLHTLGIRNVSCLARGVDNQLFAPHHRCGELRRTWNVTKDDLVATYVGRIAAEKNLELAVTTFRLMKRHNSSLKFVIVGDGPLYRKLRETHPDLIFCGAKTGPELARHYASADLFIFPSESETFGNVTLEAMASGLVVIAYDYAAAKMHIRHGDTGILAPYGDSRGFVDAALRLIGEPQSIPAIRRQAREYIMSIDWARVVERFETLLTGRGNEPPWTGGLTNRRRLAA
jgi:glycosyltransferase involved in cell wall biosynthesis